MINSKQRTRSAFTLIETVLSLSIMSVILLGLSGAVMIGVQAIPTPTQIGISDQRVIDRMNQFRANLRQATDVKLESHGSDYKITVHLKDTDVSGQVTRIEYLYESSSGTFMRDDDDHNKMILFDGIKGFNASLVSKDNDASSISVLIMVSDTIQGIYEIHAVLPGKPEEK